MKIYSLDIVLVCAGMQMQGDMLDAGKSLGGCVTGDTPVDVPRDIKKYPAGIPIAEICQRVEAGEKLHAYSYDHAAGRICLRPIKKAWRTKEKAEIWELNYSWQSADSVEHAASLRATPDHRIMLRDGSFKALSELASGDSLMPFNRFQGKRKSAKYFRIDLNDGLWEYEHHFVVNQLGIPYKPKRGTVGDVIHHENFKWYDNSADNLKVMDWEDHLALHQNGDGFREWYDNLTPAEYAEFCGKQKALARSYWDSMSLDERRVANAHSIKALKRWHQTATPEALKRKHDKISASNKETFKRSDLAEQLRANGRKSGVLNAGRIQSPEARAAAAATMRSPLFRAKRAETTRQFWAAMSPEDRRLRGEAISRARLSNHVVVSVKKLEVCEDVYDLEIEGTHNFAANGIIIHNSETAAIQMAETLTRLGHHVQMFCNTERPHEHNGVIYAPMGWIPNRQGGGFPKGFIDYARMTPFDLLIVQRIPAFLGFELQSKVNFLWQHDLATHGGPSVFHPQMWNIDKILVLSEFMKKQYQQVHGGPEHLYHITRNGIDLKRIDATPSQKRDRFRLTYTSRPERGLDILLQRVFPEIIKIEPRAKLYLSRYDDPQVLPLYQQLDGIIKQYGDRVVSLGNLGKQALYDKYLASRLYVYPSAFEEVSMITAMETAACGTPFIGPWRAALPETCREHGVLIRDDGTSPLVTDAVEPGFKGVSDDFCRAMAKKAVELMHDDAKWEELSKKAREAAKKWQWEPVAEDWIKLAHDRIAERTNSPARVVKHFLVHSDVVAAKKYAEKNDSTQLKQSVQSYIDRYMPFMNESDPEKSRAALNDFYEQRSGGAQANWQTGYYAEQEPRLQALLMFIGEHKDEINTICDFGCAHGGYARVISNAFPHIKVVGVDNSPSLIRCCNEMKASKGPDGQPACKYPENLYFAVGDESVDLDAALFHSSNYAGLNAAQQVKLNELQDSIKNGFDLLDCMEVLEHIPHAEEFATKIEQLCKPDGWIVWTTPHGRRERDELINKSIPPVHVRAFDMHDLRDMFGHRKNFAVGSFSDLKEIKLDKSFAGWFMTTYRRDEQPIGAIDWERKFFLQGPRETLAVCMMTHNADTVMRRAAKSVQSLADQFIIVDNGPSTDATIETALEFTSDVRAGTSPFFCYKHLIIHAQDQIQPGFCEMAGFETPRNESIDGVWTDWILWIDYDENLLQPGAVLKYLRPNVYYGYAIQQHHLSVDAGKLKVDLPVRLFRNGFDIRFYGKVHEHAEFGINRGMGPDVSVVGDVNLAHDGYIDEDVRRGRFDRNIRLLQCDRIAYPQRTLGKYLYDIRDNIHQARYSLELNGGNLTPEIKKHLDDAINMYRNEFLSKAEAQTLNIEGLNYYSEALRILGLGVEVCASVDLKRQGAQPSTPERFRAMDADEAKKILASRIDMMAQPLMGPYAA